MTAKGDGTVRSDALLVQLREAALGEYEVMGEVGRGGMAVVYLAHDLSLDRKVALKVISPDVRRLGEELAERFRREARISASLHHPHIIPIHAVKESGDLLFFVMPFVMGRTLESVIAETGPLPVAMVHTILNQVGGALDYAHRHDVIHRDVKPGNIMLDQEGWAVVTDFGIAKVTTAEGLTQTGSAVGTTAYMSPEQCTGQEVTGASDQYALGVVAYEMLTGRNPFEAPTAVALMYKHVNMAPEPLRTAAPGCPPVIADTVMRMLEKDPADRWPQLADALAALGVVPAAETHAVRTRMLELARSSTAQAIVDRFRTPRSPVPSSRLSGRDIRGRAGRLASRPASTVGRGFWRLPSSRTLAWAVPSVAVVLALFAWGAWWADRGPEVVPTDALPTTPSTPPATPPQPGDLGIHVVPPDRVLAVGDTLALPGRLVDAQGDPVDASAVEWRSLRPDVATVSSDGLVTATGPGAAEVTANVGGRTYAVTVTVAPPPAGPLPAPGPPEVASVAIAPASTRLPVGETFGFQATPRDAEGRPVPDRGVQWVSSDPAVARVSGSGVVTALSAGTARIGATSDGRTATATVTVTAPPPPPPRVASVAVQPANASLDVSGSVRLSVAVRDAGGNLLADRQTRWTSSDERIATVSPAGEVSGRAAGVVTITATSGDASGAAVLVVREAAPPPAPTAAARPEIEALLGAYARALQDEDLSAARGLYPGMSADEERNWTGFFANVRDLRVSIALRDLTLDGDEADAAVAMTLVYRDTRQQERTNTLGMTLRRQDGAWRIMRIR